LTFKYNTLIVMSLRNGLRAKRSIAMMFRRVLGILTLMAAFMFGTIGFAHAYGWGYSAPELDPSALGSGLALLAGGMLLLAERRRGSNN
jgi:hypothetical protein